MSTHRQEVLVVDDEVMNLELINEYLNEANIDAVCVESGEDALSILNASPRRFSAVLLDRMMPGIDGIEVLSRIKADCRINRLPVIMQTAKVGKQAMIEGLNAGAYYYLSKPYDQQTLIAIVTTAIRDYEHYLNIQETLKQSTQTLKLMDNGRFVYKSLEDGRNLAVLLANACPKSDSIVLGLTELMINAVEHGNLAIGYAEKTRLNSDGAWEAEIERRLSLPGNQNKYVTVDFNREQEHVKIVITDQGEGFDWEEYMEISPQRAFDSHGRGIAMANLVASSEIEFLEKGNKVCVTVLNGE
ncbi:MAG TPA: response regulator [Gammaproteobacteria bacterium]|nr:response regulator [Gammaproteobacteria bacterium]